MLRQMLIAACLVCPQIAGADEPPPIPLEAARAIFHEAATLCGADAGRLWGESLCGPMMFVDPDSRAIVANQPDAERALSARDGVYVGVLPASEQVANTAYTWSGVRWTQVMWPLTDEHDRRAILLMHESFHRIQGGAKLPAARASDNPHLDTLEGRYLLQLEWRALARALSSRRKSEIRSAVEDALAFRARRQASFEKAASEETALELNEGLAEYTGIRVGLATAEARSDAARRGLAQHAANPTFVRSFAYATGPAYGLLLDRFSPDWQRKLADDGFAAMLARALRIDAKTPDAQAVERRAAAYDGAALRAAETERERARQERLAAYRKAFIDGPVLTLALKNMKVRFDPRALTPLPPEGTVYPNLRVSDDWGVLEATEGVLLATNWSWVRVIAPEQGAGQAVGQAPVPLQGRGWTLTLSPGWKVVPGARAGDLALAPPN